VAATHGKLRASRPHEPERFVGPTAARGDERRNASMRHHGTDRNSQNENPREVSKEEIHFGR
jgi:hypothetical protein